jgi:GAF domain-containing protein
MSATPDSTLADPQQIIADLQGQLAECRAERDEALAERDKAQLRLAECTAERDEAVEQQTATAEVLDVINGSPGDLAPVWDAMLEKATRLCEAASGILWTYDGSGFRAAAVHGAPEEYLEWLHSLPDPVPSPSLARIASGEKIVRDDDLATAPGTVAYAHTLAGMRTGFLVALRKGDALRGAIRIFKQDPRPFSDRHIALLQNFAAQAVIAMENARLLTETREALEQQTATADVLQVINSSPGDLAPVFDAILEKGRSLCDAAHGTLTIYDGKHFRAVAMHAIPPRLGDLLRQPFSPHLGGSQQPLLQGERLVHIPDITAREPTTPIRQAAIEAGIRTLLMVPLRKDDALLGYITVDRFEVRPFSEKEIELLENFAAQAVIAMENARLITETREALEQQTATAEVLEVINFSPGDLTPVFDAILEKAHSLCGVAIGALEVWDGERLRALATRGLPAQFEELIRRGYQPDPNDAHWQLVNGAGFVHIADQAAVDNPMHRRAAELTGVRTFLGIVLRKDDTLLGRIVAGRQEVRPFAEKEIALLQNFAAQAVIAMENARLLNELQDRTRDLQESLEYQTATSAC